MEKNRLIFRLLQLSIKTINESNITLAVYLRHC